jgi:predicted nucleic acid-binding protein
VTYLIDTNVLSALAPAKRGLAGDLATWLEAASNDLFLSVVTAIEIQDGIAKAERTGATRKAEGLTRWWDAVEHLYAPRILPLDLTTARVAGRLADRARATGHDPGLADVAIAATAEVHGLILLTRNLRHFMPLAIPILNPFESLPILPTR